MFNEPPATAGTPCLILLADGEENSRSKAESLVREMLPVVDLRFAWRHESAASFEAAEHIIASAEQEDGNIGLVAAAEELPGAGGPALLELARKAFPRARRLLVTADPAGEAAERAHDSGLADKCVAPVEADPRAFREAVGELLKDYEHTRLILPDRGQLQREIAKLRERNDRLKEMQRAAEDLAFFIRRVQYLTIDQLVGFLPRAAMDLLGAPACCLRLPSPSGEKLSRERRVACESKPFDDMESHPAIFQAMASGQATTMPISERRPGNCPAFDPAGACLQVVIPLDIPAVTDSEGRPCRGMLCLCGAPANGEESRAAIQYKADLLKSLLSECVARAFTQSEVSGSADLDALTGLAGPELFERALARELARAKRFKRYFSVALIDADHFREINARCGHAAGDEVLASLADIIATHTRSADLGARYRGQQFAILLAETDIESARLAMDRLRTVIGRTSFPEAGRPVTVSIGLAGSDDGDTPEAILLAAESALRAAKAGGRNRTAILEQPESAAQR